MNNDPAVLELRRQRLLAELADANAKDAAADTLDRLYRQVRQVEHDLRRARQRRTTP